MTGTTATNVAQYVTVKTFVDVANKDRAAMLWAENATRLTGTQWQYVKVPQREFEKLQAGEFADVLVFAPVPLS
jgi:hypothetical protein